MGGVVITAPINANDVFIPPVNISISIEGDMAASIMVNSNVMDAEIDLNDSAPSTAEACGGWPEPMDGISTVDVVSGLACMPISEDTTSNWAWPA